MWSGLSHSQVLPLGVGKRTCLTLGFRGPCSSSLSSCMSPGVGRGFEIKPTLSLFGGTLVTRTPKPVATGVYTFRPEGLPVEHWWCTIWLRHSCMHWDIPTRTLGLVIVRESAEIRERKKKGGGSGPWAAGWHSLHHHGLWNSQKFKSSKFRLRSIDHCEGIFLEVRGQNICHRTVFGFDLWHLTIGHILYGSPYLFLVSPPQRLGISLGYGNWHKGNEYDSKLLFLEKTGLALPAFSLTSWTASTLCLNLWEWTHRYREQANHYQWGRERGMEYSNWGLRGIMLFYTARCKTSYKDMLYNTGNIANIL